MKLGIYRHFKGDLVKVIGVAKHSETKEDFVVYDHLGTNALSNLWVRPVAMFSEEVERDGKKAPRFSFVSEK
ncbi:MAG: DUF1653 domain-containing protein [Candidatus Paceibacterota bacterium]|jgi:hypothetical protein